MSVVNTSGFNVNEILLIKQTGNTGFPSEYVLINSSSFDATGSYVGKLYVTEHICIWFI